MREIFVYYSGSRKLVKLHDWCKTRTWVVGRRLTEKYNGHNGMALVYSFFLGGGGGEMDFFNAIQLVWVYFNQHSEQNK